MNNQSPSTAEKNRSIEQVIDQVRDLYTLPAVAVEVIQLTSNPNVDAWALRECIQADPALTTKILRVVNSSLFGLGSEVGDLNQALALLGIKPLKLLVLGFSLPENLFAEVARDQLQWYWTRTLTRAVTAKEISEQLFNDPGDDAFLAGLLQDIGILVLLGQLKKPYADFLSRVIEERIELERVEIESLGFNHTQLTAGLLTHWNLPKQLVSAIAAPRDIRALARSKDVHGQLPQVLHLAELLAELVGEKRLSVLPDLLEACQEYCGVGKNELNELVALVQPKVLQLADVLSLELPEGMDYVEVLTEAHLQMSELAETIALPLSEITRREENTLSSIVAETAQLRSAVDGFLHGGSSLIEQSSQDEDIVSSGATLPQADRTHPSGHSGGSTSDNYEENSGLARKLILAVGHCRSRRQPLSLVLLDVEGDTPLSVVDRKLLGQVLDAACKELNSGKVEIEQISTTLRVLMLSNYERQEAVRLAESAISRVEHWCGQLSNRDTQLRYRVAAGVATVALPPKNFPPQDLLEKADRCLAAAHSTGTGTVKSLEIY